MRSSARIHQLLLIRQMVRLPLRQKTTSSSLPFKITRRDADQRFANHRQFLAVNNAGDSGGALTVYKSDPIKACFVPFHSAQVGRLHSSFSARYGIDRTEYYLDTETSADGKTTNTVLKSRTVTDWYSCSGVLPNIDYPFGTPHTQIYADFEYPRSLVEDALQSTEVIYAKPITAEMLAFDGSQKVVYSHEMNMSNALEKLSARVYDLENDRAYRYIKKKYRADHVNIQSLDVHLNDADIQLFSYHMPAYIYKTTVAKLTSYKIMNAHTGEIHGNKIYSLAKTSAFGASIGGLLTLIGVVVTANPYVRAGQIILRVAIGSSLSGAFSAMWAHLHNQSNNFSFIHEIKKEAKENAKYPESDDDKARREFATDMNQDADYTAPTEDDIRLPIDKCKLLGLNPKEKISLEMVKTAYHSKIKKWHPDFFNDQNSKKRAEAMTQQLNDAYKELSDILKPHKPK